MWFRWDLEEFRKEKLHIWTRAGYVFEGEQQWHSPAHYLVPADDLL